MFDSHCTYDSVRVVMNVWRIRIHYFTYKAIGHVNCVTLISLYWKTEISSLAKGQKIIIIFHYNESFNKFLCVEYIFDNIRFSVLLFICLLNILTKEI